VAQEQLLRRRWHGWWRLCRGRLDDGRIAVRNSNHPEKGSVLFTRAEMEAWIKGVRAGEFDDLA
jgi:hypothetical protein